MNIKSKKLYFKCKCLFFDQKMLLTILSLLFLFLQSHSKVVINDKKFHGMYDLDNNKIEGEEFKFSDGKWVVFKSATSDGRVMEFHYPTACFLKDKTVKLVTSIVFYEQMNMVIAFYPEHPPLPVPTIITNMDKSNYNVSAKKAQDAVELLLKANGDALNMLNMVPMFKAKKSMETKPQPLYQFWLSIQEELPEDYLTAPYASLGELSEATLVNIYKDVSMYFAIITFIPGPYMIGDKGFDEYKDDRKGYQMDDEFMEDMRRPYQAMIGTAKDHLSPEFKIVMEYYSVLAKHYVIGKLFYSDFGLRNALRHNLPTFDQMMASLKNPSGSFANGFNYKHVYKAHKFSIETGKDSKMTVVPMESGEANLSHNMWQFMQQVYDHGQYHYHQFVKYRGKINNGDYYRPTDIRSKAGVDVMEHVFRYFKKYAFPSILAQIVDDYYEALKSSEVLSQANFENIQSGGADNMDELKKYMKMFGYLPFNYPADEALLDYFKFDIFKPARRLII